MKNFSQIKHRIKSISDTRKITGAMETISVAKMRKAMYRCENNRAYYETIRDTVEKIVLCSGKTEHKVFAATESARPAYIVIASDKGLAGGFNHTILEYARREWQACPHAHIFTVGQICREYFAARGVQADISFADASFDPSVSQAARMSKKIYEMFMSAAIDSAYIVFTAWGEHGKMEPTTLRLLPFDRDAVVRQREPSDRDKYMFRELLFEPSAEEVLEQLFPQYLTGVLYGALLQSSACEHSQRRAAMHNATHNANELLSGLTAEYNRARQETVTGELTEIVAAANGVQDDSGK